MGFCKYFLYNKKLLKINTKAKSKVFILKLSVVNDTTIKKIAAIDDTKTEIFFQTKLDLK